MGIVGGAIIPVITGAIADRTSLATALIVPTLCYTWILVYGWLTANGLGGEMRGSSDAAAALR